MGDNNKNNEKEMAKFKELEAELNVETTTGSILTYKYKRLEDGTIDIKRTIDTSAEKATVDTTISNIKADGDAIVKVSESFSSLSDLPRFEEA